jgi:1-aminocyclopropane-1-carboxylate deaminase/D-cysteine desulfhydrase-like pyridoxal-dependent ACC family enzyme
MSKRISPIKFLTLPTPLVEAPRLSAKLAGPRILIKRDDLTGLAMGGNKTRALEFLIAEAQDRDADTIMAVGPQHSNWLCLLTAAARQTGMDVILLVFKRKGKIQGNLLLNKLLGARIKFTNMEIHELPELHNELSNLAEEFLDKGHKPYVLRYGPMPPQGIHGYVSLASEIFGQLTEKGTTANYLFLASGSGCTQSGLIIGAKYHKETLKIVGINPSGISSSAEKVCEITNMANETAEFLEMDCNVNSDDIFVYDDYIGTGPKPTKQSIEAVKLVAQTEGIFLDPLYTGKAMAALIDHIRKGKITSTETVVFYHSGGLPAIFSHSKELLA